MSDEDREKNSVEQHRHAIEDADDDASEYYLSGIKLYSCVASVVFCLILSALDQTVANTAIKGLEASFHDFSEVGWTTSAFMLPLAVLSLLWGRLGMLFGRRNCLLISVFLFELGSLVAAVAPSMNAFIGGRAITGVGAAGIQTGAMIVISEISPVSKRGLLMSVVTLCIVPAAVLGPLIGGAFTNSPKLTWRWCFYINLPFGGLAAAFLFLFYHPRPTKNMLAHIEWKVWPDCIMKMAKTIDIIGLVLLSGSWVLLLLGISLATNSQSWRSALVLSLTIIGGVIFIVGIVYDFWLYGSKQSYDIPLIPKDWIVLRGVVFPTLSLFFSTMTFFAALMYISIYFELVLDRSALHAGIDLLPVLLSAIPASIGSGLLVSKMQIMKPLLLLSGVLLSIGSGLLTLFDQHTSTSAHIGYLIFIGLGFGLNLQPAMLSAQFTIPGDAVTRKLIVTSFLTYSRCLGAAAGGIVATAIYTAVADDLLSQSGLFGASPDVNTILSTSRSSLSTEQMDAVYNALVTALHAVFWMCVGTSLVTVVCTIFVNKDPKRVRNDETKQINKAKAGKTESPNAETNVEPDV
jgi:MFS family permease